MKTKAKRKKIFCSYTHLKKKNYTKNKAEKKKKQKSLNSKESKKTNINKNIIIK